MLCSEDILKMKLHVLKKQDLKMLRSENHLCHVDIIAAFGWDAVAGPLYS